MEGVGAHSQAFQNTPRASGERETPVTSADTAVTVGTVSQWWLTRSIALQATALAGLGFGAAGTVADQAERDYHYGLMPQAWLGLRLIFGERAMRFFITGTCASRIVSTSLLETS